MSWSIVLAELAESRFVGEGRGDHTAELEKQFNAMVGLSWNVKLGCEEEERM